MSQVKAPKAEPKVKPLKVKILKKQKMGEVFIRQTKKGTWAIDFVIADKVAGLKHEFATLQDAVNFMNAPKATKFFNEKRLEIAVEVK